MTDDSTSSASSSQDSSPDVFETIVEYTLNENIDSFKRDTFEADSQDEVGSDESSQRIGTDEDAVTEEDDVEAEEDEIEADAGDDGPDENVERQGDASSSDESDGDEIKDSIRRFLSKLRKEMTSNLLFFQSIAKNWETDVKVSNLVQKQEKYIDEGMTPKQALKVAVNKRKPFYNSVLKKALKRKLDIKSQEDDDDNGSSKSSKSSNS